MSYVFDTFEHTWYKKIKPQLNEMDEVVMYFEFLLTEIHDANHRVKDALNKDPQMTKWARKLEEAIKGVADNRNCDAEERQ